MGTDEIAALRAIRVPQVRRHQAHQADQAARLLKTSVLAKARIEITDARVKGIRREHARSKLLWRFGGQVHLFGTAQSRRIGLGHLADLLLRRQALKDASAQDLVELIRVQPHRLEALGGSARFLFEVLQRFGHVGAALPIGAGKVGDHQSHALTPRPPDSNEEIGESRGRHPGEVRVADLHGRSIGKVSWQLIQ